MTARKSPRSLLDVNVVLAIVDPAHEHHVLAWDWFEDVGRHHFATCPTVQNGVVRIASSAAYPNRPGDVDVVRQVVARLTQQRGHEFWPDTVSVVSDFASTTGLSSRNVTDVCLAALAESHNGVLVTFDRAVPTERAGLKQSSVHVLQPSENGS